MFLKMENQFAQNGGQIIKGGAGGQAHVDVDVLSANPLYWEVSLCSSLPYCTAKQGESDAWR